MENLTRPWLAGPNRDGTPWQVASADTGGGDQRGSRGRREGITQIILENILAKESRQRSSAGPKKARVEEAEKLKLKDLQLVGLLDPKFVGRKMFVGQGMSVSVVWPGEIALEPSLCVVEENSTVVQEIRFGWWRPGWGGRSWLFICCCGRRTRTLYVSGSTPEHRPYRCRRCANLTYRSSQQAHKWEFGWRHRVLARIAAKRSVPIEWVIREYRRLPL